MSDVQFSFICGVVAGQMLMLGIGSLAMWVKGRKR